MTEKIAAKPPTRVNWYRSKLTGTELSALMRRSDMQGALHVASHLLLLCGTGTLAYCAATCRTASPNGRQSHAQ